MKIKPLKALASVAAVVLLAAGCTGTPADQTSSSGPSSDGSTEAAQDSPKTDLEIGIVTFSATDVAVSQLVSGAEEEAASLGYTTTLIDANGSPDQANAAIENLVQKGVDAILVTVFASSALSSGLQAAESAGIPVLVEGGGEAPGVAYSLDDSLGTPLTEAMIGDLPDGSTVLMLNYRGGRPCQLREEGFDEVVEARPDLEIQKQEVPVPGQTEAARSATQAWLAATDVTPGETAIWTCFDDIALGAISSLKEQNVEGVLVYSANGTADALQAIQDGWMHTDMWINLEEGGREMVRQVAPILEAGDSWEFVEVPAQYELVTAENVDEFWANHPEIQ